MDLQLKGKRAVVAAASGGLGYAIARGLAAEGCDVAISSSDEGRISSAADAICDETGATVHAAVCDVTDRAALVAWIDDAVRALGGLDIVVANAGGPPAGTFADLDPDDWDHGYRLTLSSAVTIAGACRPHLTAGGSMLFMTSTSVKEPIPTLLLSNVYRAGVAALAKSLSKEWASDGIRVNHLIPGRIATGRIAELEADAAERRGIDRAEIRAEVEASIPLRRTGETKEYADAGVFLVSGAASYITGATLQVDGGLIHSVM